MTDDFMKQDGWHIFQDAAGHTTFRIYSASEYELGIMRYWIRGTEVKAELLWPAKY
jgi:hypothetical protein